MANIEVKQESIDGGISTTYFGDTKRGQYRIALGIDPDITMSTSNGDQYKMSNCVMPVGYTKFSSTEVDAYPIKWIVPPASTAYVYCILSNGKILRYSSALGSVSTIGTVTGNAAQGAEYYNDYIYITGTGASNNDVSRYGPLSGAAALTNGVWTGATLGTQTALANVTYPTINGAPIPKHWMHSHVDGQLYFLDYVSGQGAVHVIRTTDTGTNNGSAYNVLDLPFGYYPTSITNYGTNIAITAIKTTDTTIRQGDAALFLWDTISESFYQQITLPDVFATAIQNVNGRLYVFTGSAQGARISLYEGGNSVSQVSFFDDGISVLPGAVTSYGDRVFFGARMAYAGDNFYAVVLSYGSKQNSVQSVLHCPVKCTVAPSANNTCTAVLLAQQASGSVPRVIAGWGNGTTYGLDKLGFNYTGNTPIFRTDVFEIGRKFKVKSLRYNTTIDTAANTFEILPKLIFDNETATNTLSGKVGTSALVYKRPEISQNSVVGNKNVLVEFEFYGTSQGGIQLPIILEIETYDDQPIT